MMRRFGGIGLVVTAACVLAGCGSGGSHVLYSPGGWGQGTHTDPGGAGVGGDGDSALHQGAHAGHAHEH